MKRFKIITYKGKSILYSDLTDISVHTQDELKEAIDQVRLEMEKYPPRTLLTFTDVTGLRFNIEIVAMFRSFIEETIAKASAVVGITGIKRFLFSKLNENALDDIRAFDSAQEALDWLSEQ